MLVIAARWEKCNHWNETIPHTSSGLAAHTIRTSGTANSPSHSCASWVSFAPRSVLHPGPVLQFLAGIEPAISRFKVWRDSQYTTGTPKHPQNSPTQFFPISYILLPPPPPTTPPSQPLPPQTHPSIPISSSKHPSTALNLLSTHLSIFRTSLSSIFHPFHINRFLSSEQDVSTHFSLYLLTEQQANGTISIPN